MSSNNMNLMSLIQIARNNPNPPQFILTMLEQSQGNPVFANLLQMAKKNDSKGIESVARNMLKERGLDYYKEFNDFKHMLGL